LRTTVLRKGQKGLNDVIVFTLTGSVVRRSVVFVGVVVAVVAMVLLS